jgi:hypothetical protein
MMFCKYFTSLAKIPTNYVQLGSMSNNIFNNMNSKYIVKDISNNLNNVFLRIEKFNQDGILGTNIYATLSPVGSIDI